MCGVVGMVAKDHVNQGLYDALTLLQHRGQDAAGIVTCDEHQLHMRKGNGLVRDVIRTRHMRRLQGHMGIGHVRYPTAGTANSAEAQPFYVNSPYGISLAHNGNLINADTLRAQLWESDRRHLNTASDSEILLNVFAHELQNVEGNTLTENDVFNAVKQVYARCKGAYAVVSMILGYGVVGFCDPHSIRPLTIGKRETSQGTEYMLASESVALDVLGFEIIDDVAPGEAVCITKEGQLHRRVLVDEASYYPCLFEYVYLARPDSIIGKILVYKVRLRLGETLAEKIKRQWQDRAIDVVMPIPDTSRTAAHALALRLGIKYREGFIKNRYVGRTFIMPGQQMRRKSVRQKLNAISLEFKGKNVLLVDDSIVRGTTAKEIVQMARDAGAKNVYFASAAPQVRYPNIYGIDMPSSKELLAHDRTDEQMCQLLGVDGLIFQDLDDLVAAAREGNPAITRFEDSVFTGDYVTGDVDASYFAQLERLRSDSAKSSANGIIEESVPMTEVSSGALIFSEER
ncbi:MAG: amidophosphoribosyltransferase [Gammaproteobacteria bacterium]